MIRRLQNWLSRYRKGRFDGSDAGEPKALPAPVIAYDKQLLARTQSQWQFGAWSRLAAMDLTTIQHHPDRAMLALYGAAGHLQAGSAAQARTLVEQALAWGCDKQVVAQVLLSGAHNSLGRAYAVSGASRDALDHFDESLALMGDGVDVDLLKPVRVDQQLSSLSPGNESLEGQASPADPAPWRPSLLPSLGGDDGLKQKRLAIFVWYRSDKGGGLHENIRDTITYAQHAFGEIVVVCPVSAFAEQFRSAGASVIELDYESATIGSIEALVGHVDLVHVHPGKSRQLGLQVAHRCHAPVIMTIHGKWMDNVETYHADLFHIISVSSHIEEHIRAAIPNLRNKLSTVTNGVDARRFTAARAISLAGKYVICCSRFDHDKPGLLQALNALWQEQAARGLAIPWLMVGDGPARTELESAASSVLKSIAEVRFVGWRHKDELGALHQEALVSLAPGRSALESMAMGVPTISCGSAGGLKVIDNERVFDLVAYSNFGGFGSDYAADSPATCMDFIQHAQENPQALKRFGSRLSIRIHDNYDARVVTDRLLRVYSSALH